MSTRFDFIETDKRIIDQRLRRHKLTQQDLKNIVKGLEDDKDNSEEVKVFDESSLEDSAS